jgi:transcriptional antiterminator NusG
VLALHPGEDNSVDNALTNAGVGHWMATKTIEAKRRGRRKWQTFSPIVAPALPGYIFVHVPNIPEVWHAMRGLDGVLDVLGGGLNPKPVLEREITKLQAFIEKDPNAIALLHNALRKGDRVSVDNGPFASFEGIVALLGKAERLTVDVEIFGRTVPVDLELAQVTKLE